MRYPFISGLLICGIAAGAAIVTVRSVAGQTPTLRAVPATVGAPNASFVIEQQVQEADKQSDEMSRLNAQDAQLAHEAESLAKQLADASDEKQRSEIKEKLHATLTQQFDAQQKVRELEVSRIEAKVKKLRDTIAKRNDARRTIIDKRFDQLLSEADGLGWNSPSASGPGYGAVYVQQMVPQVTGPGPGFQPGVGGKNIQVPIYTAPAKR
jgi:hypothetical protein